MDWLETYVAVPLNVAMCHMTWSDTVTLWAYVNFYLCGDAIHALFEFIRNVLEPALFQEYGLGVKAEMRDLYYHQFEDANLSYTDSW